MTRIVLAAALLSVVASTADADACRRKAPDKAARSPAECPQEERLQPYDPGRLRSGGAPGFIDLGNGTEVRVGGRVRTDFDVRH